MKLPRLLWYASAFVLCLPILLVCCTMPDELHTIQLTYTNLDISKELDTMNNNRPVILKNGLVLSAGIIEQASAICHDSASHYNSGVQEVVSSMYLDTTAKLYRCVTSTVFHLQGGDVTATGMFKLPLGDTIPPNHDFPIVGGTGNYANIHGTYTRYYSNAVYHFALNYYQHL